MRISNVAILSHIRPQKKVKAPFGAFRAQGVIGWPWSAVVVFVVVIVVVVAGVL
jgi:hypothetical protein